MKKLNNTRVLAFAGVLIAMNVVLVRVIAIPIGPTLRITVGSVPIILASLWLGPLVGGICGGAGDLIGCILSGYAPIPLLLCSSILTGIAPFFFKKFLVKGMALKGSTLETYGQGFARMLLMVGFLNLITSQGFSTLGLAMWQGIGFWPLFFTRLPQSIFLTITNSLLVVLVYTSPVTAFVQNNVRMVTAPAKGL